MTLSNEEASRLRSQIQADPILSDHARHGRDGDILAQLNQVREDVLVARGVVDATEFDALVDPADRPSLSNLQLQHLAVLLVAGRVDMQSQSVEVFAETILADKPASRSRIRAHQVRPGSLAERDFGRPLQVDDISAALRPERPDGRIQ